MAERPDIERLRGILGLAQPVLPWRWDSVFPRDLVTPSLSPVLTAKDKVADADAQLLVAAVNALPALLDYVAECESKIESLYESVERKPDLAAVAESRAAKSQMAKMTNVYNMACIVADRRNDPVEPSDAMRRLYEAVDAARAAEKR